MKYMIVVGLMLATFAACAETPDSSASLEDDTVIDTSAFAPYCYTGAANSAYAADTCGCALGCGVSCSRDPSDSYYWHCECDVGRPVPACTPILD